jgi:hypothetical protein
MEKSRTLAGEGALPFEAAVEQFIAPDVGLPGVRWAARDLKPPIFQRAAELFARDMSVRAVKQALGISHGEAGRFRLRAAVEGLLDVGREDEREDTESVADGPFRLN